MESPNLTNGLLYNHILISFHSTNQLKTTAQQIFDHLLENNNRNNQYLLILNIPDSTLHHLDINKDSLDGIPFRLTWENTTALIKIIPSPDHNIITTSISMEISYQIRAQMHVPREEMMFGSNTTHISTLGNEGKQPDGCFWPPSRHGHDWPTLVIETGVSESLPKLREDAKWWFENSSGHTRFVLVVGISRRQRRVIIEKWQLAPPNMSNSQQPYMAQVIEISPADITGAPLTFNFERLFDRLRKGDERNVVISVDDLRYCTRVV